MKPLQLHFDSTDRAAWPWFAGRRGGAAGITGVLALSCALGALGVVLWELAQVRQDLLAVEDELQALGHRRPQPVEPRPVLTIQQRAAWNQLVAQLNTPWATLLGGLEAATRDDVALVSIEPDARQGTVRLQAEARTLEALLAYAQSLGTVEPFAGVVPLRHETNEQDPNRPVRLTLRLRLRQPMRDKLQAEGEGP